MRLLPRHLAALLFLTSLTLAAADPAVSPPPAPVPESPRVAVPNVFAYQAPAGWTTITLPNTPYPTAVEGPDNTDPHHVKAMISINTDTAAQPLTEWCSKSLQRNETQFAQIKAQVGELEEFHTDNPVVTGFRAPIDLSARGREIHYVMYFFAGNGNTKIAVTCACAGQDAKHFASIFEAAMKTFVPH